MRTVDADELTKKMCELCNQDYSDDPCDPSDCVFYQAACRAPTIDTAPVMRTLWKYYRKAGIAVCQNCNFERKLDDDFGRAVACPNCGATEEKK